ncbi:hypothetical protein ACQ7HM_13405 [Williamsia sp. MIQD14]|uniref:hypothetical protein n=1 Tax=Williamsia sp. MIQD14 TaxID=3425703 RepID=UPI003DA11D0A
MSVSIGVLRPSWLTRLRPVDLLSAAAALNPDAHAEWPSTRAALASRTDEDSRTDRRDER